MEILPDTDPEVALRLLEQVPELSTFAKGALADAAENFSAALASQSASRTMVHTVHMNRLAILEAELEKYLDPEHWIRVLDDIREVNSNEFEVDAQSSAWLLDSLKAKVAAAGGAALGVAAFVFAVTKSGNKVSAALGNSLGSESAPSDSLTEGRGHARGEYCGCHTRCGCPGLVLDGGHRCAYVLSAVVADAWRIARWTVTMSHPAAMRPRAK